MPSLQITPIETDVFRPDQDLVEFVTRHLPGVADGSVIAVTSKIVSLAEGRIVAREGISKLELVRREADRYLGLGGYDVPLTIKHGLLIAAAGIDESNSESDGYILYPERPFDSARALHEKLKAHYGVERLGILLTDSHTQPLRRGVTGVGLAFWGFKPVKKMVESEDLFGRQFKMTYVNWVDSLSSAAVLMMGEGAERRPLAVLQGAPLEFVDAGEPGELLISPEDDLYFHKLTDPLG